MKHQFLCFMLLLYAANLLGQRTITGHVVDEQNEPLIGANVVIVGTTTGELTDFDGAFSITANAIDRLEISYTGFLSEIIDVTDTTKHLLVELKIGSEIFACPVYCKPIEKDYPYPMTELRSRDFNQGNILSWEQLVAGRVAGLDTPTDDGRPYANSLMRLRNAQRPSFRPGPLVVLDGVPLRLENTYANDSYQQIPMGFINPNDIESVTFLRDDAAAALYGGLGSSGVVLLKTKREQRSKLQTSYSGNFSLGQVPKQFDLLSADQLREQVSVRPELVPVLGQANTNWQNEIYRTAIGTDHHLQLSGDLFKHLPSRLALGHTNQQGLLKTDGYQRSTAMLSLSPSFFKDHALRLDFHYYFAHERLQVAPETAIFNALAIPATQPVKDADGSFWEWRDQFGQTMLLAPRNPLSILHGIDDKRRNNRHLANLLLSYQLPFASDNLSVNLRVAKDVFDAQNEFVNTSIPAYGRFEQEESLQSSQGLYEFYLQYKNWNIPIDAMLGVSRQDNTQGYNVQFNDTLNSASHEINAAYNRHGLFARVGYDLKRKLYLAANYRMDGNNLYLKENRWQHYYGFSSAWDVAESFQFYETFGVFSTLRLRASYGRSGMEANVRTIDTSLDFVPEKAISINVGLDYGFFNGKITGNIEIYQKDYEDIVGVVQVPSGSNLNDYLFANVGSIQQKGLEMSLDAVPYQYKDFRIMLGLRASFQRALVTKLLQSPVSVGGAIAGSYVDIQKMQTGQPPFVIALYEQIYDAENRPVPGAYVDKNGDGKIDPNDQLSYGSTIPTTILGFSATAEYKHWEMGFLLCANLGQSVYNNTNSRLGYLSFYENDPRYVNNIASDVLNTQFKLPMAESDYYLEDASFLKLDNLHVRYHLNAKKWKGYVQLAAQNLITWTKYSGPDPEVPGGIDYARYPRPRAFTLGLGFDIR
jgi:TonB-dependent SusC/RagA subfamily outer membrane receptor